MNIGLQYGRCSMTVFFKTEENIFVFKMHKATLSVANYYCAGIIYYD
jgi:hypothetical protein